MPADDAADDEHDAGLRWWRSAVFENAAITALAPQLALAPRSAHAALARFVCTTDWAFGEHAGAESPLDASFWPMHPTLDRLLQYKRLVDDFREDAWAGKSLCKYADTAPCLGHRENDLTAFKTTALNPATGAFAPRYLTNREVLNLTDPRTYAMTYVYADFAWPHCDDGDFARVG